MPMDCYKWLKKEIQGKTGKKLAASSRAAATINKFNWENYRQGYLTSCISTSFL